MRVISFLFRYFFRILKWAVLAAVFLEVASFALVSLSNLMVYGSMYEGIKYVYDPYTLFHNDAFPRSTYNTPLPPGRRDVRIWLFGGSTMRGSTVSDNKTIPSFLSKLLAEDLDSTHCTLTNYGIDSFNSLMEIKLLQRELIRNPPPDVMVFYDGANDCSYFAQFRTPDAHFGYNRIRALIESGRGSFLGRLKPLNAYLRSSYAKELYDKILQMFLPVELDQAQLAQFVDAEEQRYEYLNRTAGQNGSRFLLFWQPILWVETGEVAPEVKAKEEENLFQSGTFDTMRENFRTVYNAVYERLKDKEYFVDFRNVLCGRTEPVYRQDGVHLLDPGREMVARAMERVLEERVGELWQGRDGSAPPPGGEAALPGTGLEAGSAPLEAGGQ